MTDSIGYEREGDIVPFAITGASAYKPVTLTVRLDRNSVAAGESITASWEASGGFGNYRYFFDWKVAEEAGSELVSIKNAIFSDKTNDTITASYCTQGLFHIAAFDRSWANGDDHSLPFTIAGGDLPGGRLRH